MICCHISNILNLDNYALNPYAIPLAVVTTALFILCIIVLVKEKITQPTGLSFILLCSALIVWFFSFFWMYSAKTEDLALWWGKAAYMGVPFIPVAVYSFSAAFLKKPNEPSVLTVLFFAVAALFSFLNLTTDFMITGVYRYWWGYYLRYNLNSLFFLAYFCVVLVLVQRLHWTEYAKVKKGSIQHRRIRMMLCGILISYMGSVDFLAKFGILVYPVGFLPFLFYAGISAYVILKYKFTDITASFASQNIINTMGECLLVFDNEGVVRVINKSTQEMLDLPEEEMLGKHLTTFLNPGLAAKLLTPHSGIETYEVPYTTIHGVAKTLILSTSIMKDLNEKIIATVCTAKDITQSKIVQNDLIKAKENAELSNRAKDIFLANMSHEMRTPLHVISLYLDLLSRTDLTKDQKQYIYQVLASTDSLKYLISDILDLSKIETGELHIRKKPFDVRETIMRLVGIHRRIAEDMGLYLNCAVAPEIPSSLLGDPDRLGQVLHNLIGNGLKFTGKGGVDITVSSRQYTAAADTVELLFSIKDTGVGVPPEKQDIIFDNFKQAHEGYGRQYGGSGLGLAISRKLVHLMGGDIWVKSENQKGSVFHFTAKFEIARSPVHDAATGREGQHSCEKNKKRILIVDDEPLCLSALTLNLEASGYSVVTASSGQEALKKSTEESFDLIFMDVSMPGMDGIETTRKIRMRNTQQGEYTPIIATTGHGYEKDIESFTGAGMDGWLIKPVALDELLATINKYIG